MKQHIIGARILAALLPMVAAVGFALPAPAATLPEALMNAAVLMEKSSYHVEMSTTAGSGRSMTSAGDMQSFEPLKMRMTSTTPEGQVEMIVLAPASYVKMPGAPWKKYPGSLGDWSQMDMKKRIEKDKNDITVTDLGMQTKDGQALHAYKLVNAAKNSVQTVFIDSSGRYARLETKTMVMKFTNFGESIDIVAPI